MLTSGCGNLVSFAQAIAKLVGTDTANKDGIVAWAVGVANGSHPAVPTQAAPQSAVASIGGGLEETQGSSLTFGPSIKRP